MNLEPGESGFSFHTGGLTKVCVYSRLFMKDQDNSFKEVYLLIRLP